MAGEGTIMLRCKGTDLVQDVLDRAEPMFLAKLRFPGYIFPPHVSHVPSALLPFFTRSSCPPVLLSASTHPLLQVVAFISWLRILPFACPLAAFRSLG